MTKTTNKYKHIMTALNQAKTAISGFINTLPDADAVDAVLDGIAEHVEELRAKNVIQRKAMEEAKLIRGGPNDL